MSEPAVDRPRSMRRLWAALTPSLRRRVAALPLVLLLGSVFELLSISAVYPVFLLVLSDDWMADAPAAVSALRWLGVDAGADMEAFRTGLLLLVGALFLARAGFLLGLQFWIPSVVGRIRLLLGTRLMHAFLSSTYARSRERTTSQMQQFISQQTYMISFEWLRAQAELANALMFACGIFGGLMVVNPLLVLAGGGVMGVIGLVVWRLVTPLSHRLGVTFRSASQRMLFEVHQTVGALREAKLAQREQHFVERFRGPGREASQTQAWQYFLANSPSVAIESVLLVVGLAIVAVARRDAEQASQLLAQAGLLTVAMLRLVPLVTRAVRSSSRVRYAQASVTTFFDEIDALEAEAGSLRRSAENERIRMRERLSCRGLGFSYSSGPPVLDGLDLDIRRGDVVGLVGASGSGKSTLVDLLCGLVQPSEGAVLVDGQTLRGRERDWWPSISFVQQSTFVLDGSLLDNVAFGDDEPDRERAEVVLKRVGLESVIQGHTEGLDQPVGEGGARLSGGQRQRIGIARALYADAELLILDEATANLDPETEQVVVDILLGLRGEKTIVVVAHRLASIQEVDRIFFLEQGRLRGQGSFEELRRQEPKFEEMVRALEIKSTLR